MEVVVSYLRRIRARYSHAAVRSEDASSRDNNVHKRILVAGGAGFLGSHLCEHLLDAGHHVICVDNFSTGMRRNVEPLMRFDAFSVVEHDIVEPIKLEVDQIYHLANPATPPHCLADPIRAMKTHVLGSLNLLDLAARRGARILKASPSEIYGDPQLRPQAQTSRSACYEEGKRSAQALFSEFRELYQADIRLARLVNPYGPRMRADDGSIVSNFVLQALRGKDITIYGDASEIRSFCFADDLIEGLVRVMEFPASLPAPIDLGNPMKFAVGDVAEQVVELTGSRSRIISQPQAGNVPAKDQEQDRPDMSHAMRTIGWCPRMDLSGGLLQTIGYFDRLLARSKRVLPEVA